jgi:hypothetical protein
MGYPQISHTMDMGTCKVWNEIKTEHYEKKPNKTKRNETKPIETKRNEIFPKRNITKKNEKFSMAWRLRGFIIQCSLCLSPPVLSPKFSSVPISPLKIPRYTAKLSYRHPPQVFRHKSRKTNLNSPVSTAHNYLLTAVYWSVIMECQDWSSDTVIDLIVEGRNRWVVLIRIITCIYFSSDYF